MNYSSNHFIIIIILLLSPYFSRSQTRDFIIPDSLYQKSFYELQEKIYDPSIKEKETKIYANSYLKKAENINDSLEIATAYLFLTISSDTKIDFEKYVNLAIEFSKNKVSFFVPCTAYSMKAGIYSDRNNYQKALDYYLLAYDASIKGGNHDLGMMMKYNIGFLNNQMGNHNEAIKYMKETWKYFENSNFKSTALSSMCLLSNSFTYIKELDSASYINDLGIKKSLKLKDKEHYNYFIFYEGINKFYQNKFSTAKDSLLKALPNLIKTDNKFKIAIAYSYLGRTFNKLKMDSDSDMFLKKVDSMLTADNDLPMYCRDAYIILLDKNNTHREQLHYVNQLLKLDSILHTNYRYLTKNIHEKYENPRLVSEKEKLISLLNKDNRLNKRKNYILILVALMLLLSSIFLYYNKKKKEKSFNLLINKLNSKESTQKKKINHNLDIDKKIISSILKKIHAFEDNKGFLTKKISLHDFSKQIKTNKKYLSKVINTHKCKTFKNYINDLRVDYAIDRLKKDSKFRNYTIKAIAEEVGFSNTESFSKTFRKKTNLSVSYFIKKLAP